MGLSTRGRFTIGSAQSEADELNCIKHKEQGEKIASLMHLLGTGDTKTFIQQHKLIKHAYK